jgi:SRSO17 transposase
VVGLGAGWRDDLERWLAPFLARLSHLARQAMCPLHVAGLIGPGDRRSVRPMARRLGLSGHDGLHRFVSAGARTYGRTQTSNDRWSLDFASEYLN